MQTGLGLLLQVAGFGLVVVAVFAVVVLLFLIGSPLDKWKAENPLYAGAQARTTP